MRWNGKLFDIADVLDVRVDSSISGSEQTAEIKKKAVTLIRKEPESEPAIWISLF